VTTAGQGSRAHPAYRQPGILALVAAGGAAGTLARALVEQVFPARAGQWPWATFVINVTGAFLLGLLLQTLALGGPDTGWRRSARLGLGTGVLGGFTTYSTFAVETIRSPALLAITYAVATVLLGGLAAAAGMRVAQRRARPGGVAAG